MIETSTETDNRRQFDQHLLGAIGVCVVLILATPLIISTNTIFPFIVGKAIFARSIIEIIFTLWLILIICYPQHRPSRSWVIISLSIGLSVSIITSFTGASLIRSMWSTFERMNGVIDQAHWIAFILVTGSVYRSLSSWRVLFTLNLGMAGFVSLIGIIQYYNWAIDPFLLEEVSFDDSTNYLESTWGSAAFMAAYVMINSVIGLGLILQSFYNRQTKPVLPKYVNKTTPDQPDFKLKRLHLFQISWLFSTSLCLWALWLTASRGALLSFGLGTLVLSVGYIFWKTKQQVSTGIIYTTLFLSLVAIALIIVVRASIVVDDLESSSPMIWRILEPEGDMSYSRRVASLETTIDAYTEKPVFGWGPENYLVPWGRHLNIISNDRIPPFDAAHNSLVEKLVTQGTVGLLSYILIWSIITIVLVRSIKHQSSHYRYFIIVVTAALIVSFAQRLFMVDTIAITMQLSLLIAFVMSEEGRLRIQTQNNTQDDSLKRQYTRTKKAWLIVPIVSFSIWSLHSYNYKPYQAAQASKEFLRTNLWTDISTNFNRSIDEFPPLANVPRRLMINHVGYSLIDLAHADYVEAVDLVTREGQEALRIEPQNWRFHVALAQFYQQAYLRNPDYLELADTHVQEALRLAPNTSQTIGVKVEQERLKQQAES